ncbi:FtsX-like permease family protein [Ekhidna sp.]|uniref:ABC transporter permease n=1 Tax=Ekhidna sp. TaxID=2608089 RepID=UPI0032EC2C19
MRGFFRLFRFYTSYVIFSITGLTITVVGSSLLFYYLMFSFSFDSFHPNANKIVRVVNDIQFSDRPIYSTAQTPIPLGPAIKEILPVVSSSVTVIKPNEGSILMKSPMVVTREQEFVFANPSFFKVFSWKVLHGTPDDLNKPFTMVITDNAAIKYFGKKDVVGQVLTISDSVDFQIVAIVKPMQINSHFSAEFVASSKNIGTIGLKSDWGGTNAYTYLKLTEQVNLDDFESSINKAVESVRPTKAPDIYSYRAQWLRDIYLHSQLNDEWKRNADYPGLIILLGLAITIFLLGIFNYSHLTASNISRRIQKTGIMRCLGASKSRLTQNLIGEALMKGLVTFICSLLIVIPFSHQLDVFTRQGLLSDSVDISFLIVIAITSFIAVLLGNIYPSIIISRTQIYKAIKGRFTDTKTSTVKQWITTSQFSLSTIICICTLVIIKQLNFINNQKPGIDLHNKISIPMHADESIIDRSGSFINELSSISFVSSISISSGTPGRDLRTNPVQVSEMLSENDAWHDMRSLAVNESFLPAYNLELIAGRNFNKSKDDSQNVYIVNRAFLNYFQWDEPEIALKYKINWRGFLKGPIVGVVEDFHYFGLKNAIQPTVIAYHPNWFEYITVSFNQGINHLAAINEIKHTWNEVIVDRPFEYYFVENDYMSQYQSDFEVFNKAKLFCIVAILMAGFGMLSYTIHEIISRKKEIAIRKIVGAEFIHVFFAFSKRILFSFALSLLAIIPLSIYISNFWLASFFYRVIVGPTVFISAIAGMAFIALAIIAIQVVTTFKINPATILAEE